MESNKIQNDNKVVKISKRNYLSTEKINLGNFSAEKISSDLELLKSLEQKKIPKGVEQFAETEENSKEMLALKLSNPFRGY